MKTCIVYFSSILLLLTGALNEALAEQTDKTTARVFIEYFNTAINERYLSLKVTTRIDKRHQPVQSAEIEIYLDSVAGASLLGSIVTNSEGLAKFILPPKFFRALDSLTEFTFICSLADHPDVKDKVTELLVKEIEIKTEYIDQDTLKWIRAIVLRKNGPGSYTPLKDIGIQFFVTRPFNMLAIAEQTSTDEEGKATIQFPDDLPGDATGHLVAVVKVNDSDDYGTVENRATLQWGIPTIFDDKTVKRSLWAAGANAPIYLLLLTNGLILTVWGIIFYIFYQIYRISKIE